MTDVISAAQLPGLSAASPERVGVGAVSGMIADGGLRRLSFCETEVLRGLSYPVRDENWGTLAIVTMDERWDRSATGLAFQAQFQARNGSFSGQFALQIATTPNGASITATVEIAALRELAVNRAGFALLHPLAGVAGTAMTVRHPDGRETEAAFPQHLSPGQTARNIAGLVHQIGPIAVDITFQGEVFEMEDQRNWSDASFKTYCRPLAAPKPFIIQPGAPLRQTVVLQLEMQTVPALPRKAPKAIRTQMPQVALAHEPGLSDAKSLSAFPGLPVLARLTELATDAELAALGAIADLTLELVAADLPDLTTLAKRCHNAGLHPCHVVALPITYLGSYQPEGPWPNGATPDAFAVALRGLFPDAAIGAGSLTNFTEFNRCPPTLHGIDFVTFGNTAIVHAADDMSVFETLEALPYILASARALAAGRPLRLGLLSIGMRSNPYGADVVHNPQGVCVPMARIDPRQGSEFAAAYGVGVLAVAALGGVKSLALAMPSGPLGASAQTPLGRVILAAGKFAGQPMHVTNGESWVCLKGATGGLAANFEKTETHVPGAGLVAPQSAILFGEGTA